MKIQIALEHDDYIEFDFLQDFINLVDNNLNDLKHPIQIITFKNDNDETVLSFEKK